MPSGGAEHLRRRSKTGHDPSSFLCRLPAVGRMSISFLPPFIQKHALLLAVHALHVKLSIWALGRGGGQSEELTQVSFARTCRRCHHDSVPDTWHAPEAGDVGAKPNWQSRAVLAVERSPGGVQALTD